MWRVESAAIEGDKWFSQHKSRRRREKVNGALAKKRAGIFQHIVLSELVLLVILRRIQLILFGCICPCWPSKQASKPGDLAHPPATRMSMMAPITAWKKMLPPPPSDHADASRHSSSSSSSSPTPLVYSKGKHSANKFRMKKKKLVK